MATDCEIRVTHLWFIFKIKFTFLIVSEKKKKYRVFPLKLFMSSISRKKYTL